MNEKKIYDLDSTFSFGKYQSLPLRFVLANDPDYIMWCMDSYAWFTLSDVAMDYFFLYHRSKSALASRRAEIMSRLGKTKMTKENSVEK